MTISRTRLSSATPAVREAYRIELAQLLELDREDLVDAARLVDDLNVDSLGMMLVLTWLDERGVTVESDRIRSMTVDCVLSFVESSAPPLLSIRVTDAEDIDPFAVRLGPLPPVAADPLAPVVSDGIFRLDPVQPDDTPFLYTLAADPRTSYRWRYRGAAPALERFVNEMWQQVLVQFVARHTADNTPAGHVIAYAADAGMHHAYLAAAFRPQYTEAGLAAQVVRLTVRYLFHTFPLHKIYLEVPGFNYPQIRSGEGRLFQVEGRLRDHCYYGGRYWDQYLCAIYRPGQPPDAP